jgi:serine/threonine protein kinase
MSGLVPVSVRGEVAEALSFPDPVIHAGGLKLTQILVDRKVQVKMCLYSPSAVYEIDRKVADCIFGQVHIALVLQRVPSSNANVTLYNRTTQKVAVKIILKRKIAAMGPDCIEDPMKEIAALQFVGNDHPNVLGQIDCISDANNFYSVMDFADGGELFLHIEANGRCSEEVARQYFSQILNGLKHLHSLGIYHRDMSLENMMLTRDGVCKIIDFGMCIRFPMDENERFLHILQVPPCGKKAYLPPENYMQAPPTFDGSAADVWSIGTMLCMLLIGGPIFSAPAILCKLFRRFFQGEFRVMLERWRIQLSDEAIDLIELILRREPEQRPTVDEILQHPWLNPPEP